MSRVSIASIANEIGRRSGATTRIPELHPLTTPLIELSKETLEEAARIARQRESDRQAEVVAWGGNEKVCPHD